MSSATLSLGYTPPYFVVISRLSWRHPSAWGLTLADRVPIHGVEQPTGLR